MQIFISEKKINNRNIFLPLVYFVILLNFICSSTVDFVAIYSRFKSIVGGWDCRYGVNILD